MPGMTPFGGSRGSRQWKGEPQTWAAETLVRLWGEVDWLRQCSTCSLQALADSSKEILCVGFCSSPRGIVHVSGESGLGGVVPFGADIRNGYPGVMARPRVPHDDERKA